MTIDFTPQALGELRDAVAHYDAQSAGLGQQFERDLFAAMDTLRDWPMSGRALSELTRKKRIGSFPYAMLYTCLADRITILRVVHLQSDPEQWRV